MPRTTSLSRIVLFLVCVFGVVLCSDDSSQTKEFWHISDVHLNAQYNARGDPRSNCVEPIEPGNSTHQYTNGQYECDPPASLVASAVRFMQTRNSSFVIYTGNSAPQREAQRLTVDMVLNSTRNVTMLLNGTRLFPCLGNLDFFPADFPPITDSSANQYYGELLKIWDGLIPQDSVSSFQRGGYYTALIEPGFRIIVLNTNYYYYATNSSENFTRYMSDPMGQFEWLNSTLQNCTQLGEKALLVGHVPPGVYERSIINETRIKWYYNDHNEKYLSIVRMYCETIVGQLFGHEHSDAFKLIYHFNHTANENETCSAIFISPSISPLNLNFSFKISPTNPGIRLFTYSNSSKILVKYEQYYTDLNVSSNSTPEWKLEYSTLGSWNISSLESVNIAIQLKHMNTNIVESEAMNQYLQRASVGYEKEPKSSCFNFPTEYCLMRRICAIVSVAYPDFITCISVNKPFSVTWWVIVLIFLFLPSLLLIVFLFAVIISVTIFRKRSPPMASASHSLIAQDDNLAQSEEVSGNHSYQQDAAAASLVDK